LFGSVDNRAGSAADTLIFTACGQRSSKDPGWMVLNVGQLYPNSHWTELEGWFKSKCCFDVRLIFLWRQMCS